MNYDNRITGIIIKNLRQKKGLTQDVLSGLAGIGRSHLAMIESGEKNANVDTLWRIADALGISLSELFALVENELSVTEDVSGRGQQCQSPCKGNITELHGRTCNDSKRDKNKAPQDSGSDSKSYFEDIS